MSDIEINPSAQSDFLKSIKLEKERAEKKRLMGILKKAGIDPDE